MLKKRKLMAVEKELSADAATTSDAGQAQLWAYKDKLSAEEKQSLQEQISALDLKQLNALFLTATKKHFGTGIKDEERGSLLPEEDELSPPTKVQTLETLDPAEVKRLEGLGRTAISGGKVAALCLGGGAGTRLGIDGPKGLFHLPQLPSRKCLFQLFAERIKRLKKLCNATTLPFVIMTSPLNHKATTKFFAENSYFGLPPNECLFFPQGTLPAFDYEGKILLETRSTISLSPDGNGGVYPALERSGVLSKLKSFGIDYLHLFGVDNILVRPADPRFIGYLIDQKAEVGNKSVWKADPEEKVGVIAKRADKYCVVEYSELSGKHKNLRDENSNALLFGAGNICNHLFKLDFLEQTVLPNMENSYHVAEKKIPVADDGNEGKTSKKPEKNNGIKLETFVFDVFPLTDRMAILECKRDEEFAPIKNAEGTDSPATAWDMISKLHKSWVEAAGGKCEGSVEVSPLVSYSGEGLEDLVKGKTFPDGAEIK
ncbi:unnamed protein product [Amoebophrya sp. A120]|nr:unnamed protein product [Amoebophrya sp. A120]|eukprot:GSA120T00016830001.1